MTNQSHWYYSRGGTQAGPVPVMSLRDMVVGGQLTLDDLVWSEGMPAWLPMRQVPALSAMFASAPASTPPINPLDAMGAPPPQQYAPPVYGVPQGAPTFAYQPQVGASSNGMAIAALVFSLLFPLVGLILSFVALNQMKSSRNYEGKGMATAGLIISICWLGLACFIFVLVAAVASNH